MLQMNGREAIVKKLIGKGVDWEAKDNGGWTSLLWAIGNMHEATVKLLIEKGADWGAKGKPVRLPLSHCDPTHTSVTSHGVPNRCSLGSSKAGYHANQT